MHGFEDSGGYWRETEEKATAFAVVWFYTAISACETMMTNLSSIGQGRYRSGARTAQFGSRARPL
jgi:hypothetical protein